MELIDDWKFGDRSPSLGQIWPHVWVHISSVACLFETGTARTTLARSWPNGRTRCEGGISRGRTDRREYWLKLRIPLQFSLAGCLGSDRLVPTCSSQLGAGGGKVHDCRIGAPTCNCDVCSVKVLQTVSIVALIRVNILTRSNIAFARSTLIFVQT